MAGCLPAVTPSRGEVTTSADTSSGAACTTSRCRRAGSGRCVPSCGFADRHNLRGVPVPISASLCQTYRAPQVPMRKALRTCFAFLVSTLALAPVANAALHDPSRTVTIYLHGFDRTGVDRHGVYGEDVRK